jgi:hypothetical protein
MVGYYVIFNGDHPRIYKSWAECSRLVLGVRGARYKKYSTFEEALREFQAPNDAFAPIIQPLGNTGKSGLGKKVLLTSLVILMLAIWLKRGNNGSCNCPT